MVCYDRIIFENLESEGAKTKKDNFEPNNVQGVYLEKLAFTFPKSLRI